MISKKYNKYVARTSGIYKPDLIDKSYERSFGSISDDIQKFKIIQFWDKCSTPAILCMYTNVWRHKYHTSPGGSKQ